jgi:Sec-independent protein translocase protein TatA
MFGIGMGEIVIIGLILLLVCPRDIPRILRKIGQVMASWQNIKDEFTYMSDDIDLSDIDPEKDNDKNSDDAV